MTDPKLTRAEAELVAQVAREVLPGIIASARDDIGENTDDDMILWAFEMAGNWLAERKKLLAEAEPDPPIETRCGICGGPAPCFHKADRIGPPRPFREIDPKVIGERKAAILGVLTNGPAGATHIAESTRLSLDEVWREPAELDRSYLIRLVERGCWERVP